VHTFYKKFLQIFFTLSLIATFQGCLTDRQSFVPPKIQDGQADFSQWNFEKNGPITLSGDWEFFWNDWIDPSSPPTKGSIVPVPSHWTEYAGDGQKIPVQGKASFRLRVLLPGQNVRLALRIPSSDTTFRLFVNGVELAKNGNLYEDINKSFPIYYAPISVNLPALREMVIVLHYANSQYPRPGFRDPVILGTEQEISRIADRSLFFELFLLGSIVIMALYHTGIFALRVKDLSPLYFALFCYIIVVRLTVTGEGLVFRLFPATWHISTFLEYASFYMCIPAFIYFVSSLYPRESNRYLNLALLFISLAFLGTAIFLPISTYTKFLMYYQLIVAIYIPYLIVISILAVIRKRETAVTFLFGFIVLISAFLNDLLYANRVIQTTFIGPLGVFLFFFSQAFLLSRRFALAFNTAEHLTISLEEKVKDRTRQLEEARDQSDNLLLNILPLSVAQELKERGKVNPVHFPAVTVLFSDFVGFTSASARMPPDSLVRELDDCFRYFDGLMDKYGLEKLKTIGDSYMCAGGLPVQNLSHALDCSLCALDMRDYVQRWKAYRDDRGLPSWNVRIGLHTGPVVAGVIGKKKFVYDIWGDTVNTASRVEESGESGQISLTEETAVLLKNHFDLNDRGRVELKGKGVLRLYILESVKSEFSGLRK